MKPMPLWREILRILIGAVALLTIVSIVIYAASKWGGPPDSRSFLVEPSGPTGQLFARPTTVLGTRPTPSADASKRAIVGSG